MCSQSESETEHTAECLVVTPRLISITMSSLSSSPVDIVKTVLCLILLLLASATTATSPVSYSPSVDADRFNQRQLYLDAMHLIRTSQFSRLQKLKPRLSDYTLYPYVEYFEMIYRISRQSAADIQAFAEQYSIFLSYYVYAENKNNLRDYRLRTYG